MFDHRVTIRVSGMTFETNLSTLEKFPNTLLGSSSKRETYYVQELNQYVFQRNRRAFDSILFFYQSDGKLHRPEDLPMKVFKEEAEFFELDKNIIQQMLEKEGYIEEKERILPVNFLQRRVWELFEHPDTSNSAQILAVFSVITIMISVVTGIVEPFRSDDSESWFILDLILHCWFTIEFLVRFAVCPNKYIFLKSTSTIVDFIAILQFFLVSVVDSAKGSFFWGLINSMRIFRIFRMFRVFRYSRSFRIVAHCAIVTLSELGFLVVCLFVVVVLISSLLYFAEVNTDETLFTSVPATFWCSIQTMTTVGYGDMVPVTPGGKLIAAFASIFGVLAMSLPVLTFVNNFNNIYHNNMEMSANENQNIHRK